MNLFRPIRIRPQNLKRTMEPEYEIQQILCNWVHTLPIDGQTGESIVTMADVTHLSKELSGIVSRLKSQMRIRKCFIALFENLKRCLQPRTNRQGIIKNLSSPIRHTRIL